MVQEGASFSRLRVDLQVLGVTKQSSETDIRKAYRKLAVKLHPDKVVRSSCTSYVSVWAVTLGTDSSTVSPYAEYWVSFQATISGGSGSSVKETSHDATYTVQGSRKHYKPFYKDFNSVLRACQHKQSLTHASSCSHCACFVMWSLQLELLLTSKRCSCGTGSV